jgi:hypothetical protein
MCSLNSHAASIPDNCPGKTSFVAKSKQIPRLHWFWFDAPSGTAMNNIYLAKQHPEWWFYTFPDLSLWVLSTNALVSEFQPPFDWFFLAEVHNLVTCGVCRSATLRNLTQLEIVTARSRLPRWGPMFWWLQLQFASQTSWVLPVQMVDIQWVQNHLGFFPDPFGEIIYVLFLSWG